MLRVSSGAYRVTCLVTLSYCSTYSGVKDEALFIADACVLKRVEHFYPFKFFSNGGLIQVTL